ncbi:MAG TPA: hypothetical protein VNX86_04605 [Rhizomicrobium sp.]|jgi:hypothetical protein|nr:hypothetical protein [Rhizomicrobium sp.]
MNAVERLCIEARGLAHWPHAIAALECAAQEADRLPWPAKREIGIGKYLALLAVRILMRAAQHFGDANAREALCAGIARLVDAVRAEPDRPNIVHDETPYWLKNDAA